MRRLPKDGRYPDFPSSNEDSEFTASRLAVAFGKAVFVLMAMIAILGLVALVVVMVNGIRALGGM